MTELERIIQEAVERAVSNSIAKRAETETSDIVEGLLNEHRIEYSELMHKALLSALENLNKQKD